MPVLAEERALLENIAGENTLRIEIGIQVTTSVEQCVIHDLQS
jgi:hypothetical protein